MSKSEVHEPMSREAFEQMMEVRKYEDERADRQTQIAYERAERQMQAAQEAARLQEIDKEQAEHQAREREDEEQFNARIRAEGVAQYARRVSLGARQVKVLATCLEALESLAHDTTDDDEALVAEARDRVLRSLRANFFEREPSFATTLFETLEPMLPKIVEGLAGSMSSAARAQQIPVPMMQGMMQGVGQGVQSPAERTLSDLVRQYGIGQLPGFKLQVYRTLPKTLPDGRKADGFLGEYDRAIGEYDIAREYGGGVYRVVAKSEGTNGGRHYASVLVNIGGDPKPLRVPYDPSTFIATPGERASPPLEAVPEQPAMAEPSGMMAKIKQFWPSIRVTLNDDDLSVLEHMIGNARQGRDAGDEDDNDAIDEEGAPEEHAVQAADLS